MANTITISSSTELSANVHYTYNVIFDQYVVISNVAEMLVGNYTTLHVTTDTSEQSGNIHLTYGLDFDEYVVISNVTETVIGSNFFTSVPADRDPSTNLSYQSIPSVTYVVTDGSPILLVSVYNTQYWSTS